MKRAVFFIAFALSVFADNGFLIQSESFDAARLAQRVENGSFSTAWLEDLVKAEAQRGGVDTVLALSIAKVESNFNPNAVSSSNALGLMQLKMDTAVKDIYETLYSQTVLPETRTLFDPKENAKLGVAYLWLIQKKYLKDIEDKDKLEYCTIAAYNAGAGAVLRTFHDDKAQAAKIINAISADEVLRRLMFDMQSEQVRRYLLKVLEAKKSYQNAQKTDNITKN